MASEAVLADDLTAAGQSLLDPPCQRALAAAGRAAYAYDDHTLSPLFPFALFYHKPAQMQQKTDPFGSASREDQYLWVNCFARFWLQTTTPAL